MTTPELHPIATAQMLAVGAELLAGETRDTNSGDIAGYLTGLGVEITRMTQLPDELEVISSAVTAALERVDLVVTTGGLGPTPDDLTREGIAAALGEEPHVDADLEAWLRRLWGRRGLPFSDVNLKQAWLIPSATAMSNPNGTAPGWWIERDGRVIIALPGPPRELRPMWHDQALPRLRARGLGIDRTAETLRLTGIGESMVVDLVGKGLLEQNNPRLATYARADSVDIRVSAVGDDRNSSTQMVAQTVESLSPRVDPYVFARNEEGWPDALRARLGDRQVATVEVGTAGYLGLLLGPATFLSHAEQQREPAPGPADLARAVRVQTGADIGLAVVARESEGDMNVDIAIDTAERQWAANQSVFRGGDAGRRRAANAAVAELWRGLAGSP